MNRLTAAELEAVLGLLGRLDAIAPDLRAAVDGFETPTAELATDTDHPADLATTPQPRS